MIAHLFNIRSERIQIVVLLDSEIGNLSIFIDIKTGMFKGLLGAGYLAAIYGNEHLTCLCRFNHSADMASDACQAEKFAYACLS
jgi:hypothetical protein